MKRILALCLVVLLSLGFVTGCNNEEDEDFDTEAIKASILGEFMNISEVPRESTQAKAISTYLRSWAKENDFKVARDKAYNIIIEKEATPGYEDAPTTILHSNMDMISVAKEDVTYDPFNDAIQIITDENTMYAEGTNLGADSGIGISTALYILKNAENHGPLRVIFTANGETTLSGAQGIDAKYLKGDRLINLNGMDNEAIGVGSPGSYLYEMKRPLQWVEPKNTIPFTIHIEGLKGGYASLDMDENPANAIKILGETLAQIKGQGILFELASFNGGTSYDTIPTEATALIIINQSDLKNFNKVFKNAASDFESTYGNKEKEYIFTATEADMPEKVLSAEDESAVVSFVYGILNGVQSTSKEFKDKAESTSNLSTIATSSGDFVSRVHIASISAEKAAEIFYAHEEICRMCDIENRFMEIVPAWPTNPESPLLEDIFASYKRVLSKEPSLQLMEVGHESGWFLKKNPDLEIISMGPLIRHANTPEESLDINTVIEPVRVILDFLENDNKQSHVE